MDSMLEKRFPWSKETTLHLIDLYRRHPVLYVAKDGNYKNRLKRLEALKLIRYEMIRQGRMKLSIEDIKKKIHGLRTQYAKQLAKIRDSKSNGRGIYKPTLWCFSRLHFLRNTQAVQSAVSNMTGSDEKLHDVKDLGELVIQEQKNGSLEEMDAFQNGAVFVKQETTSESSSRCETPITSVNIRNIEDDLTVFGRLVELELRKIHDSQSLRKVKKAIFNILLDVQEVCEKLSDNVKTT